MPSAENSNVGLAKQVSKGTPIAVAASFKYFMFNRGGIGANNQYIPDDDGIGSGSLLSGMAKGGVFSAGAFEFVPRSDIIGNFLTGVLGFDATPVAADGTGYKHVMTLQTADKFATPYYTFRSKVGGMQGEVFQDCKIMSLTLNWRAADHIRAAMTVIGGLPTPNAVTTDWAPADYVDLKPGFLAPVTTITSATLGTLKVLRGSVSFANAIPMDEQWITGSYSPDDFDVVRRQISISLLLKCTDATIYNKMSYDPANGAAWTASLLKAADIAVHFKSAQTYDTNKPYALKVVANSHTDNDANVAWTCAPIDLQAGKNVTMLATGTFMASVSAHEPVTVELYNDHATQY
jgi:hypothetical protein